MARPDGGGVCADCLVAPVSASTRPNETEDVGASVRAAQDAINRAIQIGGLTGDPLEHVLRAQSEMLGAFHGVFLAGERSLAEAQNSTLTTERIAKAQMEALKPELLSVMDRGGRRVADTCVVRLDRRMAVLFSVGLLIAALAGGLFDHFVIGSRYTFVPQACGIDHGRQWCVPGVWLGQAPQVGTK